MPKRKSEYIPDDFVDGSEGADAPSTKKSKGGTGKAAPSHPSASDGSRQIDDNGDAYWELKPGGTRRVGVNRFKDALMINVREYYEKDGKTLPGKKGISLPIDQFRRLIEALPQVEAEVQAQGETVPRPNYSSTSSTATAPGDAPMEHPKEEDGEDVKQNFEATSEEDN